MVPQDKRVTSILRFGWKTPRALLFLLCSSLVMAPLPAQIRHVIHISVDGLRGDLLHGLLDAPGAQYPGFSRLRAEGAVTFNARCDFDFSSTTPNHIGMVTGLPVLAPASAPSWQQHGYQINISVPTHILQVNGVPPAYKFSVFDRVHDRGGRTMLLVSKSKLAILDRSYNEVNGAPDVEGEDNGRDKIDITFANDGDSSILAAVLVARMEADFPAYTFMHIFDPDAAGHGSGWGSMNWQLAVKHADSLLGFILSALELRPALKRATALVVTADHGGGVPLLTHVDPVHRENYTIPLIMWGPGVPAGSDAYALFANRRDPGVGRPFPDALDPPLRNTDTGNIAMALLGLPPVQESYFRPDWADGLRLRPLADGRVECVWPMYLTGWTLETSVDLQAGTWGPVDPAPVAEVTHWRHVQSLDPTQQRFFRLRAPR